MSVTTSAAKDKVILTLSSTEFVTIYLFGATVTSWVSRGEERLFLSKKAVMDGPSAIRGGIPIVFPQFATAEKGHPLEDVRRHGFARISRWTLLSSDIATDTISTVFVLENENLAEFEAATFPYPFRLLYTVSLSRGSLSLTLNVENRGTTSFPFHALLFAHVAVPDIEHGRIIGLDGLDYTDKTTGGDLSTQSTPTVGPFPGIDRVYMGIPSRISLVGEQNKPVLHLDTENMIDLEIWNPGPDKEDAMSDFEAGGSQRMVTLEPGCIKQHLSLDGKSFWTGSADFSVPE